MFCNIDDIIANKTYGKDVLSGNKEYIIIVEIKLDKKYIPTLIAYEIITTIKDFCGWSVK